MRHIIMTRLLLLSIINFFAAGVAMSQSQPEFSNWFFVQSDQALQYRIAVVKQEGATATLQLQFRVNDEDEVYCKSALCDGLLLSLKNRNVGDAESTKYSFIFEKSFIGLDNIYTWPQTITTELKTWPDGSKRFFNPRRGIVYTLADSEAERGADIPYTCVDVRLAASPNEHRCKRHGFDMSNAINVK